MFQNLFFTLQLGLAASALGDSSATAPQPALLPPPSGWSTFWWGDYDGDALADAWVVLAGGQGRLLRNAGDGNFQDVTERAGLNKVEAAYMALWADFDADGRLDLFLPAWDAPSSLLRQTAPGVFTEISAAAGLSETTHVIDAEWRDYDGDGALDLHLTTAAEEVLYHNLGAGRFERVELDLPAPVPFLDRGELPLTPDEARRQRALPPVTPGSSQDSTYAPGQSVSSGGSAAASGGIAICASALEDSVNPGVCIPASSIPTLGMFHPMSSELFIDAATGRVGVNTTAPGAQLDVAGGDVRTSHRFVSTAASGAPLVVNSGTLVSNLNADKLDGFDATAFSQLGNQIETAEIANSAVTTAKIATGAVNSLSVLDDSLTAADLATDSVGKVELAPNSVGASELVDESVGSAELGPDSVGSSELQAGAVTSAEILAGSIGDAHVAVGAAIAGNKIAPNFGNQFVESSGAADFGGNGANPAFAVRGDSNLPDTTGYLGIQGTTDFDGFTSVDWSGREIGMAGVALDSSFTDNYGVYGHSNGVGVRGENENAPTVDFGELGLDGIGLRASGTNYAADLNGAVDVDVNTNSIPGLEVRQGGLSRGGAFLQTNATANSAALFASSVSTNATHSTIIASHTGNGAGGVATFESLDPTNTGINTHIYNAGTNQALFVEAEDPNTVAVRFSRVANHLVNNDMLQVDVTAASSATSQFVEFERGGDVEFRVDGDGDVFADGAFTGPADFAEMIAVSSGANSVQAGDVMVIDPAATRSVRRSWQAYSTLVAGVYSTKPGFVGSERDFTTQASLPGVEGVSLKREDMAALYNEVPVAVVGIVPCKVSVENGPILPGTLLVTSSTPGHAMGDNNPPVGTVVGKALEAFDGSLGRTGSIKILVTLQ